MPGLPIYHTWTCDWNKQTGMIENTEKVSTVMCKFSREGVTFPCWYMLFMTQWHKKNVGRNVSFVSTNETRLLWWRAIYVCVTLNAKRILLIITIQQQLWTSRRRQNQAIVSFLLKFKVFWIFSLAKPHLLIFLKEAPTVG